MTITKKILFFLGAVFFLTCSSTYIKVQAAQDMPDKSVQIGKKTTMQVKDSTLSTQNKAAWIWKSFCKQTWHRHRKEKGNRYNFSQNSR